MDADLPAIAELLTRVRDLEARMKKLEAAENEREGALQAAVDHFSNSAD